MNYVLLLGAGFSRNWGGWLAGELFEYLLGHPKIINDQSIKGLLWKHKNTGFENALYELQSFYRKDKEDKLKKFESAIVDIFSDMNQAFFSLDSFNQKFQVFFSKFNAVFSLNQDLLFEANYHCSNDVSSSPFAKDNSTQLQIQPGNRWVYWQMPGIFHPKIVDGAPHKRQIYEDIWSPAQSSDFVLKDNYQPYFKLHGSSNWRTNDGEELLIVGGDKTASIKKYEVLSWYQKKFSEYLSVPNTRLMIIG